MGTKTLGALKTQDDVTFHRRGSMKIFGHLGPQEMYWWLLSQRLSPTGLAHLTGWLDGQKKRKKGDRLFWTTGPEPADQKSRVPPWTFRRGYQFNPVDEIMIVPPRSLPVAYLLMCWWNDCWSAWQVPLPYLASWARSLRFACTLWLMTMRVSDAVLTSSDSANVGSSACMSGQMVNSEFATLTLSRPF